MRRPTWRWRGYDPRPADDGRCTAWGGRCDHEEPRVWFPTTCAGSRGRCHRSDAERAEAVRQGWRGWMDAFGLTIDGVGL